MGQKQTTSNCCCCIPKMLNTECHLASEMHPPRVPHMFQRHSPPCIAYECSLRSKLAACTQSSKLKAQNSLHSRLFACTQSSLQCGPGFCIVNIIALKSRMSACLPLEQGVPVLDIEVQPQPLTPSFFSTRTRNISESVSTAIYSTFQRAGLLNETGFLLEDPR